MQISQGGSVAGAKGNTRSSAFPEMKTRGGISTGKGRQGRPSILQIDSRPALGPMGNMGEERSQAK